MPFAPGVGVTDFLTVAKLAGKAIKELKETGEAAPKYQTLLIELEALSHALSCINTIQPEAQELVHLEAVRATASACKRPLEEFLSKIQKYDKSLGSWDAKEKRYQGFPRRMQFNLALEEDVKELRATLTNHTSIINMLLLTQVLSFITVQKYMQSDERGDLKNELATLRRLLENETKARESQSPVPKQPSNSCSDGSDVTSLGRNSMLEQFTGLTARQPLELDGLVDIQAKHQDTVQEAADSTEFKRLQSLPSKATLLDIESRMQGTGSSILALLSLHNSLRPRETQDEKERALLQDLATASNYKTDKNFVSPRIADTCEWFFEDQTFKQWRDCPESSLIWVTAGPGCGKSVLARALIDERRLSRSVLSSTVCYFFFKDSQERRTQGKHALGALLHQLFQASDLITHGLAKHRSHGKGLLEAFDEMWDILLKAAKDPDAGEIICVIDALDECEQTSRLQLLDRLITFYSQPELRSKSTVLKFLITSRPYEDLDDRFQRLRDVTTYVRCDGDEHSQQIAREINIVIDARIKDILPSHSQSDQTLIANRMKSQGNRTYLWLFLTIDIIKSSRSKYRKMSSIQSLMDDLPIQIADAYEEILTRSSDKIVARRLLHIIVAAREPLTLQEANIALTLATQPECQSLDELEFWPPETFTADIKNICGLLVTCYDDKIALIHQTAREFLLTPSGPAKASQKTWRGSIETTEADELMAEICTKYLIALDPSQLRTRYGGCVLGAEREETLDEEEADEEEPHRFMESLGETQDLEAQFPLLQYSAQNWASHYRNQTHYMAKSNNPSFQRALVLCDAEALYCEWWLRYVEEGHFRRNARSSLLLAIHQGLDDLIEANLSQHSDKDPDWVNCDETEYNSIFFQCHGVRGPPLHLASARGRLSTVKTLLDFGADINLCSRGLRPLHTASMYPHQDRVEIFLNNGADVNASVEIGKHSETYFHGHRETALVCAVESGRFQITDLLLRHGANVNARASEKSWTVLLTAIHSGQNQITRLLLDHKADTELTGGANSLTPLQYAALRSKVEVIQLLLERGADVNAKSANDVSAMHIASQKGQKDIMKLLLDAGADINAGADIKSGHNLMGTPLWLAALENHPQTISFLLDHGANANISIGQLGTPLGVAKSKGFRGVVDILVSKGGVIWNDHEREMFEPSVKLEIPWFMRCGRDLAK